MIGHLEQRVSIDVVAPEPGRVVLEESLLEPPGPGQVLIEAEASVVSPGTERAWFTNAPDTPGKFPYRPGYCHVGTIVEVGRDVSDFQCGDRVLSRARHGSLVCVNTERLWRVPDGLAPDVAAFAPLAFISLQGVRKAGIELGSSVCILGAGIIGLLALQFAKLMGGTPVFAADLSAYRREIAKRCGATDALDPTELVKTKEILPLTERLDPGFERVIDATGHPSALNTSITIAAGQGSIVLLGSTRGRAQDVNVYDIHRKGLHIIGAHGRNCPPDQSFRDMWTGAANTELALRLLQSGALNVDPLVTDRVSPEAVPQVFERLKMNDDRLIGCVIEWQRK